MVKDHNTTLQEDGWTGMNNRYLMRFMIASNGRVFTVQIEDHSIERKSGDHLFERLKDVKKDVETTYKVTIIAVVTDAGPDGRKARRLFAAEFPHIIVLDCYAHQVFILCLVLSYTD